MTHIKAKKSKILALILGILVFVNRKGIKSDIVLSKKGIKSDISFFEKGIKSEYIKPEICFSI